MDLSTASTSGRRQRRVAIDQESILSSKPLANRQAYGINSSKQYEGQGLSG